MVIGDTAGSSYMVLETRSWRSASKLISMSKAGQSSVGFRDSSFVEELEESFAQDRQSTGHSLFRARECGAEVVNPLSER